MYSMVWIYSPVQNNKKVRNIVHCIKNDDNSKLLFERYIKHLENFPVSWVPD